MNVTDGAVDLSECPTRHCVCKPRCEVCGFGKHSAVHGPFYGQPPGSKPYDHRYIPGVDKRYDLRDSEAK
jgi:hypothetical protein